MKWLLNLLDVIFGHPKVKENVNYDSVNGHSLPQVLDKLKESSRLKAVRLHEWPEDSFIYYWPTGDVYKYAKAKGEWETFMSKQHLLEWFAKERVADYVACDWVVN